MPAVPGGLEQPDHAGLAQHLGRLVVTPPGDVEHRLEAVRAAGATVASAGLASRSPDHYLEQLEAPRMLDDEAGLAFGSTDDG
ncbi:hypothetical protein [Spirillospora sp. NBC_01491]|uniref:hypothetical protein n=1 Tax=Spirillospora sp. NBC_01491 TaxID=2976007 RepID=UPI002E30DE48|nr:hypothetical protein [Spirillospora sp. NBC_01491]